MALKGLILIVYLLSLRPPFHCRAIAKMYLSKQRELSLFPTQRGAKLTHSSLLLPLSSIKYTSLLFKTIDNR